MSRSLAEQFQPIVDVHGELQARSSARVDIAQARSRIQSGRPGFDAAALIASAGDIGRDFERTATAFERTGVASATTVAAVKRLSGDTPLLARSWVNSESEPRDAVRKLGRSIAGIVGNALLGRAASDVTVGIDLAGWKWPHCPCCGASPDLALATDRKRTLVCWRCDTMWSTKTTGCLGCGESDAMTIARVPSPFLGYELAICNACGRYLKERRGSLTHALLVERALIAGLDEAAQQRGLRA